MTIHAMSKLLRVILPVCGLVAPVYAAEPSRHTHPSEATATIENNLPADGCSYVIEINGTEYAPDAATLAAIRERDVPFGRSTAEVEYTVTGRTATVECGFNTHRELPEVSLVFQGS